MRRLVLSLGAALLCSAAAPAFAADPVIPKTAVKPDPTHVSFILAKDIKWTKQALGQYQAPLYGDPAKPGPYGILVKWLPGNMSRPHFHTTDRYAFVVAGTLLVVGSLAVFLLARKPIGSPNVQVALPARAV